MAHSVESHLSVDPEAYDGAIRAFVPGYVEMLRMGVEVLRRTVAADAFVVDLGAGTGGFAERVAEALPAARLRLVDVDGAMLARARERLARFGDRVTYAEGRFQDPLPPCDAVIASLSLHHVPALAEKGEVYRGIHRALRAGGVFVNADATMRADEPFASLTRRLWAEHLVAHGDTLEGALARFDEWAREDTYFSVGDELAALKSAGFARADVLWRTPPTTVIVAVRGELSVV